MKSQTQAVLQHLIDNKTITSWEAITEYGATRLSAIIYNLRKKGYIITTDKKLVKNRFGQSTLIAVYQYGGRIDG